MCKIGEPISFRCIWSKDNYNIEYNLSIFPNIKDDRLILSTEKLTLLFPDNNITFENGFDINSSKLLLRKKIYESNNHFREKEIVNLFFHDLATFYYYNFQPSFLKGDAFSGSYIRGKLVPSYKKDFLGNFKTNNVFPYPPSAIGKEGGNLLELLCFIKEQDQETFSRFIGYLKRFVKNFNNFVLKENGLKWQFDMGGSNFPYYDPDKISDGLVRAAAIALLCSIRKPPALIMIEEIENGINQKNLHEFLNWLRDTSDNSKKTQFIFTSHSPSVIREFSQRPDSVYNFHLKEKDFITLVTNLNDAIKPLVNMGTVEGEEITVNNKKIIAIKPFDLVELFYNGVLGEI